MTTIAYRREAIDGASEVLTLCKLGDEFVVQVCRDTKAREFVGLYDLDGSELRGNCQWEAVETAPVDVIESFEAWGNYSDIASFERIDET